MLDVHTLCMCDRPGELAWWASDCAQWTAAYAVWNVCVDNGAPRSQSVTAHSHKYAVWFRTIAPHPESPLPCPASQERVAYSLKTSFMSKSTRFLWWLRPALVCVFGPWPDDARRVNALRERSAR